MKTINRIILSILFIAFNSNSFAQGWPENYGGVMLQGFSWDSYVDSQWSNLERQADDLSRYFSLIWIPQSGNCNSTGNVMGYMPVYYFDQNSSFGTEQQLRSMIKAFKERQTGVIADVVINHRNVLGVNGSWVDFPAETYNGTTYQMLPTDITLNDDGGQTKDWADKNGFQLGNRESYQDFGGARDIDHSSENARKIINTYLSYLLDDLGYSGFRYDMVKGYAASYTGLYNSTAKPRFSVGEYWEGNSNILKNWINGTKVDNQIQSAAFDFPFRYTVRDAINQNNWEKLDDASLASDDLYKRYSVTFVENHDMQDRGNASGYQKDPILRDTLAANAYLIAMPGTPCVFLPHWKAYKQEIKAMINARKLAGITNTSAVVQFRSAPPYHSKRVVGNNGELLFVVGKTDAFTPAASTYTEILSGYHYKYFLANTTETAWIDKASGTYEESFRAKLTAVSATDGAQLAYTLDGTQPTAGSKRVANGTEIDINESCTLTAGLLVGGVVKGIISRDYVIRPFTPHQITVFLKDPEWTNVYFYSWANDGKNTELLGSWPGREINSKTVAGGENWYCQKFDITAGDYSLNIIFNQGRNMKQTVDIGPINSNRFYEIDKLVNGKYTVREVDAPEGIDNIPADRNPAGTGIYSLDGRLVRRDASSVAGLQKGVYIVNGRKIIIK